MPTAAVADDAVKGAPIPAASRSAVPWEVSRLPAPGSLPATLPGRLLARLIDAVAALVLGGGLLVGGLVGGDGDVPLVTAGSVLLVAQGLVQWWLLATRGYTFGRLLTGLRVLTVDIGHPLGLGRALLRELVVLALAVTVVGPVLLAGSILRDDRRRGWQDRVVGAMAFDVDSGLDPSMAPVTPGRATARLQGLLGEQDRRRHRSGPQRVVPDPLRAPDPARTDDHEPVPAGTPAPPAPPAALTPRELTMNQQSSGRRVVPRAPHEQVSSTSYRALSDEVEHTRLREARSKVAYAPTRAQTRPRATLLLWDNRVVVLEGTALVGRNPSPREGEALPVQVIAVVDRGRSVSKTHLAIGVDADGVWLRDRNSTNGTVVTLEDGQQILCAPEQMVRVPVGASVAFGDYWLTVAG